MCPCCGRYIVYGRVIVSVITFIQMERFPLVLSMQTTPDTAPQRSTRIIFMRKSSALARPCGLGGPHSVGVNELMPNTGAANACNSYTTLGMGTMNVFNFPHVVHFLVNETRLLTHAHIHMRILLFGVL